MWGPVYPDMACEGQSTHARASLPMRGPVYPCKGQSTLYTHVIPRAHEGQSTHVRASEGQSTHVRAK
jgi:hypothetical protein